MVKIKEINFNEAREAAYFLNHLILIIIYVVKDLYKGLK